MTFAEEIVQSVASYLKTVTTLTKPVIVIAYNGNINPAPVENGIVSVGIDSLEIGPRKTVTTTDGSQTKTMDRDYTVNLKVSFFVPYSSGSKMAYELFDKVYTALMFCYGNTEFISGKCGTAVYEKDTEALVVESVIVASGTVHS